MSFEKPGSADMSYFPCRYGNSRLLFRGPKRTLEGAYCAVIGGTETYGKFIPTPYSSLLEQAMDMPVVNLGCVNAGIDVFVNDATIMEVAAGAKVAVIQALGAQNMSNRFYAVHPRRNDRFLRASAMLKALYPGVDFTEFHFTRHMLIALKERSESAFEIVVAELQVAWQARMRMLATRLPGEKVLLWFSTRSPDAEQHADGLGQDPLFVTRHMLDTVRPYFNRVVEVSDSARTGDEGTDGMMLSEVDALAAAALPGPAVHRDVADALEAVLRDLIA
ncbi:hypothetical protein SAMN05444722_3066 [Rhodovulum sp. ES.010]|uniref:DUF6473 family protein n=1 Tax=Rhodovulum sp. ES.010 TaxID=1882821 RepID=UPI0009299DC7|nr:DUF6473 family protein [Rhodovulum sp. ES.010]SIO52391.1 hypothetical protein SAMN05444722_3066 [Rhodovulum sp. ES.010]